MASPGTKRSAELLAATNIYPTTPKSKPLTPQQIAANELRSSTKRRKLAADQQETIADQALAVAEAVSASPTYRIALTSEAKKARSARKERTEAALKKAADDAKAMPPPISPAAQARKRGGSEAASKPKKSKKKQKAEQAPAQFDQVSNEGTDTTEQSAVHTPEQPKVSANQTLFDTSHADHCSPQTSLTHRTSTCASTSHTILPPTMNQGRAQDFRISRSYES